MIHNANHVRANDDGLKVGGHQASSASSATIITALLMPSQRSGSDSLANADMADYEGSLENDNVMAKVGGYYYCAYKYYPRNSDGTAGNQRYALYQTDGADNCQELYTCPAGARLSSRVEGISISTIGSFDQPSRRASA